MTIPRSGHPQFTSHERAQTVSNTAASNGIFLEILLVDDEPYILSALSISLADSSHQVITALGGQNALDQLQQRPFDLVITDLNMPGVDGITVLRRAKEIRPGTKVILMTGSVLSASTRRLVSREANGFLPKPFGFAELHRAVTSCLNGETLPSSSCRQTPCNSAEALAP